MKKHDVTPEFRTKLQSVALYTLIVLLASVVFAIAVFRLGAILALLRAFLELLRTTLYGVIFAFLLFPFARAINAAITFCFFRKKPHSRIAEGASIALTYLLIIVLLCVLLLAVLPTIGSETAAFTGAVSSALGNVRDLITAHDSLFFLRDVWNDATMLFQDTLLAPQRIAAIIGSVLSGAYNIILALIISAYMLVSRRKLGAICAKIMAAFMPHTVASRTGMFFRSLYTCFMDFIFYRLIFAALLGAVSYAVCLVCAIPYRGFITLVLPICSIIPVFGPTIGTGLVLLVVVSESPLSALILLATIVSTHVLGHRLIGKHMLRPKLRPGIAPCAVAVFVFFVLFGILGAILAVPVCAAASILLREIIVHALHRKGYKLDDQSLSSAGTPHE